MVSSNKNKTLKNWSQLCAIINTDNWHLMAHRYILFMRIYNVITWCNLFSFIFHLSDLTTYTTEKPMTYKQPNVLHLQVASLHVHFNVHFQSSERKGHVTQIPTTRPMAPLYISSVGQGRNILKTVPFMGI